MRHLNSLEVTMRGVPLLTLALLLPGCVYTSAIPLGDPAAAPFDQALVGDWIVESEGADDEAVGDALPIDSAGIRVHRFNQHEYLIEYHEWACAEFRVPRAVERRLRAFISTVDTVRFLNIQDIVGDTAYMFAHYTINGAELRLRFIADGSNGRGLEGSHKTSAALLAAVRARLNDPELFEKGGMLLVRPRAPRLTAR
jgi:hypothetical protein